MNPNRIVTCRRRRTKQILNEKTQPTIFDFLRATGQNLDKIGTAELMKYTHRDLIRVAARWEDLVSFNVRESDYDPSEADPYFTASLQPDCAKLEVEGIKLLSRLEAGSTNPKDSQYPWLQ